MAVPVTTPRRDAQEDPQRRGRRRRGWKPTVRSLPYLLIAPALVFELLVHIVPMLTGVGISFLQLNQMYLRRWLQAPFVGLSNYGIAFDLQSEIGADLLRSIGITLAFSVVVVSVSWALGTLGATLLQSAVRGRSILRTIFLIPYALPVFTSVIVWKFMFDHDAGMVNHVLAGTGLGDGNTFWLLGDNAFVSMCVVAIWRLWPFAFLTVMAGLQSIPNEIYEAADVDGANRWKQFRTLTLPMLRPVNQVLVLVLFLWTFNDFNVPFTLFAGSVPDSADLISLHVFENSFITWNFGLGSAMSVLMLAFLLVVTAVYSVVTSRRVHDA
ncbi:sugar ABC transporter permease [Actinomycetes bacterium KLBMP 9759]